MSKKKSGKKMPKSLPVPDLGPLVDALADVRSFVDVSHEIVVNGEDAHGGSAVLRAALGTLDRVIDQLEDAQRQLAPFRKKEAP